MDSNSSSRNASPRKKAQKYLDDEDDAQNKIIGIVFIIVELIEIIVLKWL